MIEFEFKEETSHLFGTVLRPVADIFLRDAQGNKIITFFYIDSGADMTLLPKQLGELLGFTINNEKIINIGGIGNQKIPAILKKINLIFGDKSCEVTVAWALIEEVPPLLGRKDIFDKFNIVFDQRKRKILFVE